MNPGLTPLMLLAGGGLLTLGLGAVRGDREGTPSRLPFAAALASALGAGAAALLAEPTVGGAVGLLDLGPYSRFFTALFCGLTALALLFAKPYAERRGFGGDELYGMLLWAGLGMALTASATHWLAFFVGYELLSLCLYVLIALPGAGALSGEAGLKYFFLGAVTSAFLVFGIALLYAATGTLRMAASVSEARPWVLLGLSCLLVGVAFKLSLVPFHLWAADVYGGAAAPVTAFLASGSKVAVFAAVLRVSLASGPAVQAAWAPAVWCLAALTVAVGNVGALTQPRAKRLLAYSSIAQMGYLLLALLGVRMGGGGAAVFYALVYAVMDFGVFAVLGTLSPRGEEGDLDRLTDLRGLGHSHPWRSAAVVSCLISLAGLPPTGGFIGKLSAFLAVFRAGFAGLGILALLASLPAVFLYLRLAATLYGTPADAAPSVPEASPCERLGIGVIVLLLLWLGVAPSSWMASIRAAVASLP